MFQKYRTPAKKTVKIRELPYLQWFEDLNSDVFDLEIKSEVEVKEGLLPGKNAVAIHDEDDKILLDKALFDARVPESYVKHILFHEMLHSFMWAVHQYPSHGGAFRLIETQMASYGEFCLFDYSKRWQQIQRDWYGDL